MSASPHRRPTGRRRLALAGAATLVAAGLGAVPLVVKADAVAPADLAHDVLPARDGWAASGSGTTGGRAADAAHVFTVSTRAELARALAAGPAGPACWPGSSAAWPVPAPPADRGTASAPAPCPGRGSSSRPWPPPEP
ncbi:hypothetical protein OG594_39605 [Streptomyces sp. NBC_01214]|uniref:hypothetical protein n=1 Tax=Streptomyces sp. NBC_01214 TaxID=2903777 RepID=UPI0022508B3D|nr:hypothetical protein [Streptomyces sp. NBC_01214]MCX4807640.1 hypothetical protein [Streptomyces sp. NBC_01214]